MTTTTRTRKSVSAPTLEVTPELWALMGPELQARLIARDPERFMGVLVGASVTEHKATKPTTRKTTRQQATVKRAAEGGYVVTVGAAEASAEDDGKWGEIATHVHERRIARREGTKLGGLTKTERREIASAHRDELNAALKKSRAAYDRKWAALVKAHKSA